MSLLKARQAETCLENTLFVLLMMQAAAEALIASQLALHDDAEIWPDVPPRPIFAGGDVFGYGSCLSH